MHDRKIKKEMRLWMKKYWGTRCKEYEKSCALCNAWKAFDTIFEFVDEKK